MTKRETASLELEVETQERDLDFDMLGHPKALERGTSIALADGSSIAWEPGPLRKGHGFARVLHFVLTHGRDVAVGVLANYLYEKLKGRATILRIDRQEVQIDEGEIKKVLTEHIEKKE